MTLRSFTIGGEGLVRSMQQIATYWAIDIRYSSKEIDFEEARDFVNRVKEVHQCLRGRP